MILEKFAYVRHRLLQLIELGLDALAHLTLLSRFVHLVAQLDALIHFTTSSRLVLEAVGEWVVIAGFLATPVPCF